VDEAETAEQIAEEGLWIPVLRAAAEPEADLALIVDSSMSMAVWDATVRELVLLMQRLAAFRAIRGYTVDPDENGRLSLLPLGGRVATPVDPDAIIDPTRRRLMIVVTDGIGTAWYDGRMDAQLQRWARVNRLQVIDVLPRRMWPATGLRTSTRTVSEATRFGDRVPVPVVELSLAALRRRAGSFGEARGAATLVPPGPSAAVPPPIADPAELVRRFLSLASPPAQQLAGYLTAAPLTLPSMRLIQQVMLPDSDITHLAEVFVGGLLRQRFATGREVDIDTVEFEFLPGVRDLFLDRTDRFDMIHVLTALSGYVTDRLGQPFDFPALLLDPDHAPIPDLRTGTLPIALITASVLRGLGPRFAGLADRLTTAASRSAELVPSVATPAEPTPPPTSPAEQAPTTTAPATIDPPRSELSLSPEVGLQPGQAAGPGQSVAGQVIATDPPVGVGVLIADAYPLIRRGLRTMLESETWVAEVFEATTEDEAVSTATDERIGLIAVGVGPGTALADGDGIDAVQRIITLRPEAKVMMMAMTGEEEVVARALRAGVRGYVLKDTDPDTVIDALRTVAQGGVVLGPRIAPSVLTALNRGPVSLPAPFNQLTARERDILGRVASGDTNARIARNFGLSEKTVRAQLSAIFAKLGVTDRVQAALLARDVGLGR
jgi:DNA-binding NarL/FixJ family response regulator